MPADRKERRFIPSYDFLANFVPDNNLAEYIKMIIAVDFDGTIVEHRYPKIGAEIPFAIDTLKKLTEERHKLILWSVREGELLEDAIEYCRKRGLEFYAVNSNYPEESEAHRTFSRKLQADLFIDDRNLGGLPDWGVIYRMIHERLSYEDIYREAFSDSYEETPKKRKGLLGKLLR